MHCMCVGRQRDAACSCAQLVTRHFSALETVQRQLIASQHVCVVLYIATYGTTFRCR